MGHFSMEKSPPNGSLLGGNQHSVEIQHLPTAESVAGMAVKMAEIGGDVKALQSSVLATNRLVERIDQWLLATSKGPSA